jgi:hypothetical protein
LLIAFKRASADLLPPLSWCAQLQPMLGPCRERYVVWIDMLAGMDSVM